VYLPLSCSFCFRYKNEIVTSSFYYHSGFLCVPLGVEKHRFVCINPSHLRPLHPDE
jgi:hypothetical protein